MTLPILAITTIMTILVGASLINLVQRLNINEMAKEFEQDYNLLHMQQMANMAYSKVYFKKLSKGIREGVSTEEIKTQLLKDGIEQERLNKYRIMVKDGDVLVSNI